MPFGISSAPEVFQRQMHEVIEGLEGVEIVADDYVTVGFGDTEEEAVAYHDLDQGHSTYACTICVVTKTIQLKLCIYK